MAGRVENDELFEAAARENLLPLPTFHRRAVAFSPMSGFICAMPRLTFPSLACALLLSLPARADVPLPKNVLDPATVPEAWNVIGLATSNIETLLKQKRADELATQVSLCSPSLRTLVRLASSTEMKVRLDALTVTAFGYINNTAAGGIANDLQRAQAGYAGLRHTLDEIATLFNPATVRSEIFHCQTHPEYVSTTSDALCEKCREPLIPRRIPYSFIYTLQVEPTLRATATPDAPLSAGRQAAVKLTLKHGDGRPVTLRDLLVEHTQHIHLLLVDSSLTDFHRIHPQPAQTPGEFTFTFTPRHSAPYRLWVDVTPAATGLAEFPTVDLPSTGPGDPVSPLNDDRAGAADGLRFQVNFLDRNGTRPRTQETRVMRLTVTDEAGQPVPRLAPLMAAFAHLTGFYDDGRSIVRLHPEGGPILRDDIRGGPALAFRFYPPKAGRIRFFCEVVVDGRRIVAPLDLGISP